ncbi:MAG: carbohydrate-binding protein [Kiritimatiellae bacterium]|nr:carbohydrate-binding protein [Kiritimatiellia bacterium]MDD4341097.1 carbohydrate-binding protein [Kiritimatiellia bacterium]
MLSPLHFIYVRNIVSRTVTGTFQEIAFAVRVLNIGHGKRVGIHWCGEDGDWRESPADYRCTLPGGDEVWVAEVAVPLTMESSIPGNIQFSACLERGDERYWDSRFGSNYRSDADSGVIVFDALDLRVVGCRPCLPAAMVSLPLEVAVRQEIEPTSVIIHWTTDGWATRQTTPAYFRRDHWDRSVGSNARNPNRYGWGIWAARLALPQAYRVEFVVECHTASGVVWDNHAGGNYRVQRDTLKVMTLNLHTYQEEEALEKLATVARAIRERDIDLVCLQEVGENWNGGEGDWASNAARIINDQLPRPYHLHTDWSHRGFDRFREGVAILSRHPFRGTDAGYVSDSTDPYDIHARKIVMAQVSVPFMGMLHVFSAHLSWPADGFRVQFERLRRWAAERHTPEVIGTLLCGDFNIAADSEAFGQIVQTEAFEEQVLKIWNPPAFQRVFRDRQETSMQVLAGDGRIDHIWLSRGSQLRAIAAEELFTSTTYGRVSDHTGYLVEFELR